MSDDTQRPQWHDDLSGITDTDEVRLMAVFLPDDPFWLLFTLRQAAELLKQSTEPLPMLILSRSPANWLWHSLLYQVISRRQLAAVRAVAADLPCQQLAALFRGHALQEYPSLELLAYQEMATIGKPATGVSKKELDTVLGWLAGHSISHQAQRRRCSHKTLYTQRSSGMKKILDHHPHIAGRFPGGQIKRPEVQVFSTLSAFEREFVHAIHCRQIFPVFQPITDGHLKLQGIEVLSRWRRNGKVLPPGEFLPRLKSEYTWLVLTEFVLQETVQQINQNVGDYYFAVNIPPNIADNENILRMIETARQQLGDPLCAERLVLEFAETIDVSRHGEIEENISQLQQQGFRLMLDDCFSQSSVQFPVRSVRFNAYKLDMSIINDLLCDPNAKALVESLIFFCQVTGSYCIAEGVDSLEKFDFLRSLGIDHFQGYLFSSPVNLDNLKYIIERLGDAYN